MTLRPAPLAIAFGGGVDLRTDSKQVPTTKLLDLQNCVFTKLTTISKRNGHRALSTLIQDNGGVYSGARGLAERDGEVLLFTDKRAYSYRPSADRWADSGEVAATTATTLPIARTGTYQTQPDVAERHGIRVAAWEDSRGGVWCSVIEAATGRYLLSQTRLDGAALARDPTCLAVGDVLHVLWTRSDLGSIQLALVNPAHPATAPVVSTLTNDLNAGNPSYDAEAAVSAPAGAFAIRPGLVAWAIVGGWRIGYLHPSGVLGSPATGLPSVLTNADAVTGAIALSFDPVFQKIGIVWVTSATTLGGRVLRAGTFNTVASVASLAVTTGVYAKVTSAWGGGAPSGGFGNNLFWAAESSAARSDLCAIDSGSIDGVTGALGAQTRLLGHGLASRAWHDGAALDGVTFDGDVYVMIAHTARFFPYVAALRLSGASGIAAPNAVIVSRLMPGEASGALMRNTGAGTRAWTTHLPNAMPVDLAETDVYSRQHAVCVPYRIQLSSQNGDQFSEQGLKLATVDFLPAYQSVQLGRGLYLSSSMPMHYDGDAWHEADFHCAPDFGFDAAGAPVDMTTAIAIGAAGAIANGAYLYAWWYEAVDAQGELHRGPPSVKMLVTMAGGPKKFTMAIPACRLTRFANVRICVARSPAGATGTDSTLPLFRVTSNDVTVVAGDNRYVLNDPTVDTVSFTDNLDDIALKAREELYTNGGILPNSPAPWHGGIVAVGKSRLFYTDTTDPHLIRYTQQIADDTAIEAPIDLSLRKDPFGGPVTAIGVMDDTVVPFSTTAVYVFAGPGPLADPNANPEANAFTAIELVSTDVGCITATSIGQTPVGLTFQSAKGIMMLTRDRKIVNIGNDVQKFDFQKITHATLIPSAQRIVYLTDSGRSPVWDYNRDSWSTFTNHEGLDAIVLDGLYYYLRTDGRVFVETPKLYLDDNSTITMVIETAWIHFAQYLQSWQRILYAYFLGRFISDHTLVVRYRLDYDESYSPEILNDVNGNWSPSPYGAGAYGAGAYGGAGGAGTRYQRHIHINKRSQAISFRLEDRLTGGYNDAITAIKGATFTHGWLCDEINGGLAPVLGGVTLAASGAGLVYGDPGPRGGGDRAVGCAVSQTGKWDGGALFSVGLADELVVAWVIKWIALPTAFGQVCGNASAAFGNGWSISGTDGTSMTFGLGPGSTFGTAIAGPSAYMVGAWQVGLAVIDRSGLTDISQLGVRELFGTAEVLSVQSSSIDGSAAPSASHFTVGTGDWVPGNDNFRLAALFVGKGPGVAAGLAANLSTALAQFATAVSTGITPGASFELSELLLVGGVLGPVNKIGAARSA
jgi:hypothetical protein